MSKSKKVLTRILFGGIMIAILSGLLYLDWWLEDWTLASYKIGQISLLAGILLLGLPTAFLLLLVVLFGFLELSRLSDAAGLPLLNLTGLGATCLMATYMYWGDILDHVTNLGLYYLTYLPLVLGFSLLGLFIEQMIRFRTEDAMKRIGVTLLAVIYLGFCGSLIYDIRAWGVDALVLFLAAVKCTDIGAYFTGVAIGKHKMIPWLSPGKTWEGLIGGLATAAGVSVFVAWAFGGILDLEIWELIVFGVVMGIAGQFADLCESLLKRSADVKDAGSKVPEFGGVLDIIDSPLLAAPVALIMLAILS